MLWIHLEKRYCHCIRLTQTTIHEAELKLYKDSDVMKAYSLIETAPDDIVVLDGLIGSYDEHSKLTDALELNQNYFHIQVASLAFVHRNSDYEAIDRRGIKIHEMYPWSLKEYKLACDNTEFFDFVKEFLLDDDYEREQVYSKDQRDELIDRKYYLAGVNVRWMFAKTSEEIEHYFRSNTQLGKQTSCSTAS